MGEEMNIVRDRGKRIRIGGKEEGRRREEDCKGRKNKSII
jgi:hypothetical protein